MGWETCRCFYAKAGVQPHNISRHISEGLFYPSALSTARIRYQRKLEKDALIHSTHIAWYIPSPNITPPDAPNKPEINTTLRLHWVWRSTPSMDLHGVCAVFLLRLLTTSYAFNLRSSHLTHTGTSFPSCVRTKKRPSSNPVLHSYIIVSVHLLTVFIVSLTQNQGLKLTTHAKQSSCHSPPNALTTVSTTGRLHFLHFPLYLFP